MPELLLGLFLVDAGKCSLMELTCCTTAKQDAIRTYLCLTSVSCLVHRDTVRSPGNP